jgi:hypothetical protein
MIYFSNVFDKISLLLTTNLINLTNTQRQLLVINKYFIIYKSNFKYRNI